MARIVQKFGGTSVADLDRIRNVAQRVRAEVYSGHEVAVVVSAMSGRPISWLNGRRLLGRCMMPANMTRLLPPVNR